MKINIFKIKAKGPQRKGHPGFDNYVKSMEEVVKEMIPESVACLPEDSLFIPCDVSFETLNRTLPIVEIVDEEAAPSLLSLRVLTREECTHGIGLFLCQMIDEKLLPGKKLEITFLRSLSFQFIIKPKEPLYIIEFFIAVDSLNDLKEIKKNFPRFEKEVRLTTLGVEKARKIVLAKGHNLEEKRMILLENFSSLLKSANDFDRKTLFSDVQHLLLKGLHEEDPNKIPDHLLPYIDETPKTFDHHIFHAIDHLSQLFEDSFSRHRPLSHLSRVISFLYLFRKMITHSVSIRPQKRHVSFKVLPFKLEYVPTLSLLLGTNFVEGQERFGKDDFIEVIQKYLPDTTTVPNTTLINEESHKGVVTLYLEMQMKDGSSFPPEAIKALKKKVPKEIHLAFDTIKEDLKIPSDEIARNVVKLTKEISNTYDPPKVVIQYHNQSDTHYYFTALLAYLQVPDETPLTFASEGPLTLRSTDRKVVGILKNRYVKQIYIFDIALQKNDPSIKAGREAIFEYFKKRLKKVHDFNGGMIARKYENLASFKALIPPPYSDALAENFFYSITPTYMQTLATPETLKNQFLLVSDLYENGFFEGERAIKTAGSMVSILSKHAPPYLKAPLPHGAFATLVKKDHLYLSSFCFRKEIEADDFLKKIEQENLTV